MNKFLSSYMEDAYKAGLEDAYKGIKPLNWAVTKYGMSAPTLVGLFVIRPFLKGGFELDYNGETVCTPPTLSKAKKLANNFYKKNAKERLGL